MNIRGETMKVTVREALSLWFLRDAKIIAGMGGLGREITSVNIMEVPDIEHYVKPGELLLTTAYPIKDDEGGQARLVPALNDRGLSGLAIKPKRFINEIPDVMIQQADALDFPLIQLPQDAKFNEILVPLVSEIINRQAARLRRTDEIHKKLTQIVLRGESLDKILETLGEIIQRPVSIHSQSFDVIASWGLEKIPLEPGSAKELAADYWHSHAVNSRPLCKLFEVMVAGETYAYLSVWSIQGDIPEIDIYAVEEALTVIALEITKREAVLEVERHYKNQFILSLIFKPEGSRENIIAKAETLGIDLSGPFRVVVLEAPDLNRAYLPSITDARRKKRALLEITGQVLQALAQGSQVFDVDNRFVILYKCRHNDDSYRGVLNRLIGDCTAAVRVQVNAGASSYLQDVLDIGKGYNEAVDALTVCSMLSPGGLTVYTDIGVYKVLLALKDDLRVNSFYEEVLGKLFEQDRRSGGELLHTLKVHLSTNMNINETSRRLYLHYNTVRYRLDKIAEQTGYNLQLPEDRFMLEMALKLYEMRKTLKPIYNDFL